MDSKLVSVIIPTLGRSDLVDHCLNFLSRQSLPPQDCDIILVDNDASQVPASSEVPQSNVRHLKLGANYGTAGAINRGVAASSSKYLLFLNNDVELASDFLATLVWALDQDHQYGFATGKLLSARDRTRLDGAGDALLLGGGSYRLGHGDRDTGQFDQDSPVLAGCGAATLFRRSVFEEIQGFDEAFFAYLDDVDLAVRAQLCGHKGLYAPRAVAYHIGSATLGDPLHPKIVELLTRNQVFLLLKNFPAGILLRLVPRILIFQLLWFGFAVRRGRLLPYLRGFLAAIWHSPGVLRKRRRVTQSMRISSAEFLSVLRMSEQQVYAWHRSRPAASRSALLNTYFRMFSPGELNPDRTRIQQR